MENFTDQNSIEQSASLSPARSEVKSKQKYSKISNRAIKPPNILSVSCTKDTSYTSKLHKRSQISPEIQRKTNINGNLDFQSLIKNSSKEEVCGKCGYETCICLPKLMKKIKEKSSIGQLNEDNQTLSARKVYFLQSVFVNRPATILFDYPSQCQKASRINERAVQCKDLEGKHLYFKISESVHTYNCMVNALVHAGFNQINTSSYNIKISGVPTPKLLRKFNQYQKTNHFPGIWQIGRKDNLWRNIYKMRRKFGKDYEICPKTYILPEDYSRFQADTEENPKGLWILKPSASSCGRGIRLVSSNTHLSKKTSHIVSKYISNPHIINGFKYDLRVYVCVTSFDPLRIYIYNDGLVRFATEKYAVDKRNLKKRYVHLTNFSVNKRSEKFVKNKDPGVDGEGSKWSLKALQKAFKELGLNYESILNEIEDVIIKALISIEPHIVNTMNQTNKYKNMCFEVYGFDILLDQNLKPWLLEVNVCPSLSSSSPLDKKIKTSLMCDMFTMVGIVPFNRKQLDKDTENQKINRLLGLEKSKILQRNLITLQNCKSLDEYSISEEDLNILCETDEENYRTGNFRRIFPLKSNVDYYSEFFDAPRYNNILVWKHLKSNSNIITKSYKQQYPFVSV
jgi:tubulin polyglutamylase TTLL4